MHFLNIEKNKLLITTEIDLGLLKIDPLDFYGPSDQNIKQLMLFFPELKIVARGHILKITGQQDKINHFTQTITVIGEHIKQYNRLNITDIDQILNAGIDKSYKRLDGDKTILHRTDGKPIRSRTSNQWKLVQESEEKDLIFAVGPAGTGKSYIAVALAVRALKQNLVSRIILTRPAVDAGESLGFLPGDFKEKLDPYMQPLYDALSDMLSAEKLAALIEKRTIQIAPLAFMRGRTLDDAFVILDEAQNTTIGQMKMFLTRMGSNAKFLVTGDLTQVDLPKNRPSGLLHAISVLKSIKEIAFIHFDEKDVVRHKLVGKIIQSYNKSNNE